MVATFPRRFRSGLPPTVEGGGVLIPSTAPPSPPNVAVAVAGSRLPATATAQPPKAAKGDHHFTDFCRAVVRKDARRLEDEYASHWRSSPTAPAVTKAAMGETSGTAGGYLVPPEFSAKLLEPLVEDTFIYPRANVIPMGAAVCYAPVIDATTVRAAGVSALLGGVTFRWGFGQAPTEVAEPGFRQVQLTPWDLLGYADVSNQQLADMGPEGEDALIRLLGLAGAWYAEYAFLRGTGAANLMPTGVLNAPCTVLVNRTTGGTIVADDFGGMAAKLLPSSWKTAVWATHPTAWAKIAKIGNFFLNTGGEENSQGYAGMIMGRPLFVTEKLPALGTAGDLVLFDPARYVIGARQEVLIDASEHVRFANYQTEFRVWLRLDGFPQLDKFVTLQDATSTASVAVVLN